LSFFDERPSLLAECVASLGRAGVDHVVAADGAYALFPGAKAWSQVDQHEAIVGVCRGIGLGLTLHVPSEPWFGNETEKRTALFALGELVAGDDGWLWVIDADETVTSGNGLRQALDETDHDVGEVLYWERCDGDVFDVGHERQRRLFRAGLGITVGPAHWRYATADGRVLWGHDQELAAEDLLMVRVEHRPGVRSARKRDAAA
jgi:hypothetical protein